MRRIGIDEAGYGPLLGPLAIIGLACEDDGGVDGRLRGLGVADSKTVHRSGDLAPLERVVLPLLAAVDGSPPAHAAAAFAVCGDGAEAWEGLPWLVDGSASRLALPLAAQSLPPRPAGLRLSLHGALIHPARLNQAAAEGRNKAAEELLVVGAALARLSGPGAFMARVDRLGGRKFYRDALAAIFPEAMVLIHDEGPGESRYRIVRPGGEGEVSFRVGGESDALVAAASCICKYLRELHMHLFNAWALRAAPGLRPTAGYPEDAKRFLGEAAAILAPIPRRRLLRGAQA